MSMSLAENLPARRIASESLLIVVVEFILGLFQSVFALLDLFLQRMLAIFLLLLQSFFFVVRQSRVAVVVVVVCSVTPAPVVTGAATTAGFCTTMREATSWSPVPV